MTKIVMFWEDRNWQSKGAAENVWLNIFPEVKEYTLILSSYCDISSDNIVEVKRKSDIYSFVKYLQRQGYKEKK